MSEISAIYIIQHLEENFEYIKAKHTQLYSYFKNKISLIPNCNFHLFHSFHDSDEKIILSCFSILFNNYNDECRIKLIDRNIECRKYYHPLQNTVNALNIYNNILCIPCTVDMDFEDIEKIIDIISNY